MSIGLGHVVVNFFEMSLIKKGTGREKMQITYIYIAPKEKQALNKRSLSCGSASKIDSTYTD